MIDIDDLDQQYLVSLMQDVRVTTSEVVNSRGNGVILVNIAGAIPRRALEPQVEQKPLPGPVPDWTKLLGKELTVEKLDTSEGANGTVAYRVIRSGITTDEMNDEERRREAWRKENGLSL